MLVVAHVFLYGPFRAHMLANAADVTDMKKLRSIEFNSKDLKSAI